MKAGKHSQAENSHINGRKIVAGVVRDAGREHDGSDSSDLDGGIELAQPGGAKASKARHYVDSCCAHNNENIATDHGHRHPERYRQMIRHRLRKNTPH